MLYWRSSLLRLQPDTTQSFKLPAQFSLGVSHVFLTRILSLASTTHVNQTYLARLGRVAIETGQQGQ